MSPLDRVVPTPALCEVDDTDLALPLARAWEVLRHGDLGGSPLVHALFALRALRRIPDRHSEHRSGDLELRLDDLKSSIDHPGFQVLVDEVNHEVVVGAIGKVWHLEIPFVHVVDAEAFRAFSEPGFVKIAWAIRISPLGEHNSRCAEVRRDEDVLEREHAAPPWSPPRKVRASRRWVTGDGAAT